MRNLVAFVFMNGLGNFIFVSAAVKILKQWGYDVDLITDERFLRSPTLKEVSKNIFHSIETIYDKEKYEKTFMSFWSIPLSFREKYKTSHFQIVNWNLLGTHEVQLYLETIGASWEDYDGYIFEPDEVIFMPQKDKMTIALSNCATSNVFEKLNIGDKPKKRYRYFPVLSKMLIDLGYEVVLIGLTDELDDCEGINFVDQLTVKETAGVIKKCDLLIAPSTGNTVIADAVGTPVVLLEGPMQTARAHPINVPYAVVRSYMSCAPCFQKSSWKLCKDSICMKKMTPEKVIQVLKDFIPRKDQKQIVNIKPMILKEEDPLECDKTVAYLIPCHNRYHILKVFLDSFKNSNLVNGKIFFLDDDSFDPRIWKLLSQQLDNFSLEIDLSLRDSEEKFKTSQQYKVNPSVHAYNILLKTLFKDIEKGSSFDYVIIIDPDIIMKPNWIQKMINLYEELSTDAKSKIGVISPFNADHLIYDEKGMSDPISSNNGHYRFRKGSNLPYMMSIDFLKEVHGLFNVNGISSSDIGKSKELVEKGFLSVITVPSMVEHYGAYATISSVTKGVITSEDFYE